MLQKINENLSHFDGPVLSDRVQELRTLYLNASNQADFLDGFIGGPLHKIELEDYNGLLELKSNRVGSSTLRSYS